ncbi:MAG: DUF3783 domain-containing protein [Pseudobutyrivibrio sp.]|nr:DUF3783 domain-containing protein [Pseudobutyrivibrio sp.]
MVRVFVYNLKFNQIAAVNKACAAVGGSVVNIKKDDLHKSIESLIDSTKGAKAGKDALVEPTELLIFDNFSSEAMDEFLDAYNSTGVPKVIFKAAITPINRKWTPAYLYEQLKQEIK